ncbi:hypothetical protein AMTR_s00013p00260760 [Amborella trichopoda]|uniref:Uncharacterized protein n=1 Tax=Amborella trichopoda TaxID=13333 RepID=W1PS63_AMBTC|nr:hypothetical protein AMTR_s00013p00260760 [Amborella trichopoda]
MLGSMLTPEILNVLLTGSSSKPFLTQIEMRESIGAMLWSLSWGSLSQPPTPSNVVGLLEPVDTNKSPRPGVPLVSNRDEEIAPLMTTHAKFPKTDVPNDVLATLATMT